MLMLLKFCSWTWQFICNNWRVILMLAMVLAILHYKNASEKAELKLKNAKITHQAEIKEWQAANMTLVEKVKEVQASHADIVKSYAESQAARDKANAENAKVKKALKSKIEQSKNIVLQPKVSCEKTWQELRGVLK